MRYYTATACIIFIVSTLSIAQDGSASGGAEWREAANAIAASQAQVWSVKSDGREQHYYTGDEGKLGEFLKLYVAMPQPAHLLIIDGKWNAINDQPVEPFRYDWMLRVPSGTAAENGVRPREEKGSDPLFQYPSVHVSANSDRIIWQYLVIPESLKIVPLAEDAATDKAKSTVGSIMDAAAWSKAMAAWNECAAKRLEEIRKEERDPSRQWMEMRSSELSKWLPEYRVFAFEVNRVGRASIYALDKSGAIVSLGSGEWSGKEREPFRNPDLAAFLKTAGLKVTNADEAVSVAKLVEDISSAASTIGFLKINTKDFRVLDRRIYGMLDSGQRDWKYTAEKEKDGWAVKKEYIGPPASVMMPFEQHLVIDANDVLTDVEWYRGGLGGK